MATWSSVKTYGVQPAVIDQDEYQRRAAALESELTVVKAERDRALTDERAARELLAEYKRDAKFMSCLKLWRVCDVCHFPAWEPTPEGGRCWACWLQEQLDEAKIIPADPEASGI